MSPAPQPGNAHSIGTRRKRIECHAVLLCVAVAVCVGCNGGGHVDYTSLDYANIDPPTTRITHQDMPHCYWWTDERGQLWVAMERHDASLFGPAWSTQARVVFVLECPPAGRGRNYLVGKREMRGAATFGIVDVRYTAIHGVMGINRDSAESNELRGSFRIMAGFSVSQMLGGWGNPAMVLMIGNFVAIHDEQRGRRIVQRAEFEAWEEQTRPPTSQPTTKPRTAATSQSHQ